MYDKYLKYIKLGMLENLWPTRCSICDKPGYLLCPKCESQLPFIDQLFSCKKCGEPYAINQCCRCTTAMINNDKDNLYFRQCKSATILNKDTGRIISLYKDAGERRLSKVMAYFMAQIIHPTWKNYKTITSFIPSSKESFNKRGFDHCEILANEISKLTNIRLINLFNRPKSVDQRVLTRQERNINMQNIFTLKRSNTTPKSTIPETIILVDDVFTTGATLNAASKALTDKGFKNIYCLTFSRTF